MPASKRQKTGEASSVDSAGAPPESPARAEKGPKERDQKDIPPHEYICIHRPRFDVELEYVHLPNGDDQLDEDEAEEKYEEGFEAEQAMKIYMQPASEHKDRKWVMMWDAWKMYQDHQRKGMYCNPDRFSMYIYNDWHGWGLMEIMENALVEFNKELKKKGGASLRQIWVIVSALGLWLNEDELADFIGNEDGDKVKALTGLIGCALLTALEVLDSAGELKPDSQLLDIPLVISYFLEWAHDLEAYGIEDNATDWLGQAVLYFKKAGLDPNKGVASTAKRLHDLAERYEVEENGELAKGSEKDPWDWDKKLRTYKKAHGTPSIGGKRYDITKMSRAERASYAFDGKDPLADIPLKALKEDLLDFGR
ncbi:hypothetical protein BCR34DRAFT_553706 [Clohesyomyces aquaticus]|uniref:SAP domain-containing protein n=1 Tax=Clohesyomyces aquaticus TaxID=1231657 RepID=A0A1Y2A8N7_9PLEO|nr:hypothetical protein BCR34DRAFT_553706 [Clohesyomyces aquaticus]